MTSLAVWILITFSTTGGGTSYGPRFIHERDCQAARGQIVLISPGSYTHHCVKVEPAR